MTDERNHPGTGPALQPKVLDLVLDFVDDGVVWVDKECRIRAMSRSLAILLGVSREETAGAPCREVLGCRDERGDALCDGRYSCIWLLQACRSQPEVSTVALLSGEVPYYTESIARPLIGTNNEAEGVIRLFRRTPGCEKPAPGKDRLIRHLYHEIRTPLTTMQGYLDLLLSGDADPLTDQQREFLREAARSVQHLTEFVAVFLAREIDAWWRSSETERHEPDAPL